MALDFGKTTQQLLAAVGDAALTSRARRQRFADTLDRALAIAPDAAASRTAAVGRRPFISARTGPEELLASKPPPPLPADWTALAVDGSHIDIDRHLPLRCYLINLGGCVISYGASHGCELFSEPTLAAGDAALYLRQPDGGRDGAVGETVISGPLLGALRTVREVERLADTVDARPPGLPTLALLDGTLAFWDLQRGNYPAYVSKTLIDGRLRAALERLRAASERGGRVTVAAYTSRPQTAEVAGAVRVCLCDRSDDECARHCGARRSDLMQCDAAADFDDREIFDALLAPGHRSPIYQSGRLSSRYAVGLTLGKEWNNFYYLNGGDEIARVEVPDWVASDPELLAMGHAMLVKQCELGLGYPVVISEAHEQAVVSGHDRSEFRKLTLRLMEQQGLPTPESAKTVSKRLPWV